MSHKINIKPQFDEKHIVICDKSPRSSGGRPATLGQYIIAKNGIRGLFCGYCPDTGRKVIMDINFVEGFYNKISNTQYNLHFKFETKMRDKKNIFGRIINAILNEIKKTGSSNMSREEL